MNELSGKRVTVMGLGRFGGGAGTARWLCSQGARVRVTDFESAEKLEESLKEIEDLTASGAVTLRLGGHDLKDFTETDLVVVNPAVPRPWANKFVLAAKAAGVAVTTEIVMVCERLPSREQTIAITGSAGKSTTSAMIHHILVESGVPTVFGGNIGGSLLGSLERMTPRTWVVLELSSAMLHWLGEAGWSPHVAVVTNLAVNHVDWHGSAEHYAASKRRMLEHQQPGDVAIVGAQAAEWPTREGVTRMAFAAPPRISGLAIPGAHNEMNAGMAVTAVHAAVPELKLDDAAARVRTFQGLPHRLRFVGEFAGVRCYNDSKSTTPESCLLALEAFAKTPGLSRVHLIAGGYDKGSDLSPVAATATRLAGLYTIGKTGPAIAAASGGRATQCGTLDKAVTAASAAAKEGDVLLLSPACASWDQFDNYERRGELFEELVSKGGGR